MSAIRSFFTCVVRGHRWDISPGFRGGRALECVRCGLHADPDAGLG